MFRSEPEKVNIVIGEAIMALIRNDTDVSNEMISKQLNQMLEAENNESRRRTIRQAIEQFDRLFGRAVYSTDGSVMLRQPSGPSSQKTSSQKKAPVLKQPG
ncbi:hypothetical protein P4910_21520 [Pantoea stewartii]|uniref:hypothetical protein n=1 Tax=Pantoea stewartii TaxID=66269 RepID=UPI0023F75B08|nr:hypothetical protein [Pantoea stewartii]MDF7788032.1 hypothetical protein [Pantoea stewartii]